MSKCLEKVNMLPLEAYTNFDRWYSYLINDYIPNQHPEDMEIFVMMGFNAEAYIIYRNYKEGNIVKKMQKPIKERFKEEFNINI